MPMTVSEKACQNWENCMELNKLKKSRSKSIQKKIYPESNKYIDEQPQHNIDFNLVEPNKKDGAFHSQYNFIIY